MATLFTLDASIFVAHCRRSEQGHASCVELLGAIRSRAIPLIEPALMPIEVAAALTRFTGDTALATEYARKLMDLPRLIVVSLDLPFCLDSMSLAARFQVRGADAVYVAVALMYGARLVTLDREQLRKAPANAEACGPAEALRRL